MSEECDHNFINSFSQEFQRLNVENAELWVRLELAEKTIRKSQKLHSSSEGGASDSGSNSTLKNKLIQKDEVAKRLNKSTKWVENYCKSGVIPFIKIGRSVFYNWDDVAESLKANSSVQFLRKY
jgi:hypothetical protein